jgi:hypothetical protein
VEANARLLGADAGVGRIAGDDGHARLNFKGAGEVEWKKRKDGERGRQGLCRTKIWIGGRWSTRPGHFR